MKIIESRVQNRLIISIIGEVHTKEDEDRLLNSLNSFDGVLDITFLEARVLSTRVVIELSKLISKRDIKITVLKSQLFSYLSNLSIPIYYLPPKSILNSKKRFTAIAIGGSADSLKKIIELVKMVQSSNIVIFIVQHIRSDIKTLLPDILSKYSPKFRVKTPENGEIVHSRVIYIAPPAKHLVIENSKIYLLDTSQSNFAKPSIDVLFNSLAKEYKDSLIAILLCGYGMDGFKSLLNIEQYGGAVLLEEPSECGANSLLKSAISQGEYDYIMRVKDIGKFIIEHTLLDIEDLDRALPSLLESIYQSYGYDYRGYQRDSIKRRLTLMMKKERIETLSELKSEVLQNPQFFEKLFLEFSITVSTFFRDSEIFKTLRERVFPYLNSFSHIKIWCAGCSSGEEVYSIAIILKELNMLHKTLIYATDINPFILNSAKNGLYSSAKLREYEDNYRDSNGVANFSDYYIERGDFFEIDRALKERVIFFQHSLISSGVFNEFQLILCRNVLIYFDRELQIKVLNLFYDSLDRSGFLTLGKSERFSMLEESFSNFDTKANIYKKNRF